MASHEHNLPQDEENQKLLPSSKSKSPDKDEGPLILPPEDLEEIIVLEQASTQKNNRWRNILIVCGMVLIFVLPLLLFTFFKPVRAIFRVIAQQFQSFGGQGTIWNYVLAGALGVAFVMFGISLMLYEMVLGYCFQTFWESFLTIMVYRLIGISITHGLSKFLLYNKIMDWYQNSMYFHAFRYMALKTPYKTLFLIRFTRIPMVLGNYGIPLFGYNLRDNLLVGMASSTFYVTIYVSLGLSARSIEELETMGPTGGPVWLKYVPFVVSVIGVSVIIYFFFYAKAKISDIMQKYELEQLKERIEQRQFSKDSSYGALE